MSKAKLDSMTKKELEAYKGQLKYEIDTLKKVIEASDSTVFGLLIDEVKKEMNSNVAEEEWKKLKENQKKVESFRSIEKTLQNQENLLERKEEELELVEDKLKYCQQNLFENTEKEKKEPEYTGYSLGEDDIKLEIKTGDIYEIPQDEDNEEDRFVLIKKSAEIEGSYAMLSNFFNGELCLQYPSNFKILEEAACIGNIYEDDCGDYVMECLKVIGDYQEKETAAEDFGEEAELAS